MKEAFKLIAANNSKLLRFVTLLTTETASLVMNLLQALTSVGVESFREVLNTNGVSEVGDLKYFSISNLKELGLNHVQASKILELSTSITAGVVSTPISTAHMADGNQLDLSSGISASEIENDEYGAHSLGGCGGMHFDNEEEVEFEGETANDNCARVVEFEEESDGDPDEDPGDVSPPSNSNLDCTAENCLDLTSRTVNGTRMSSQRRADLRRANSGGKSRFRPTFATTRGEIAGDGACCNTFLSALDEKLLPALRTRTELNRAGSSRRKYYYPRLQACLVEHAFDSLGNFCCHSFCLVRHLKLSTALISRIHKRAIELAQSPTTDLLCSEI